MDVGRIAQYIDNFKRSGLLPGDAVGIDRIDDNKFVAELTYDSQRVIKVAIDRDNPGSVSESLDEFSGGNFARRENDNTTDPGPGGVGSGRSGGVSGRCANQGARLVRNG